MSDYTPLDMSDLALVHKSTQKDQATSPGDSNFLKLPETANWSLLLRLLPALAPAKRPWTLFQAHRLRGKMYICPRTPQPTAQRINWLAPQGQEDCPVCRYWKTKWSQIPKGQQPSPDLKSRLGEIKAMVRCSWNVVVRKLGDQTNVGPLVWTCGILLAQKLWSDMLGDEANNLKGKGDIFHPKTGRDFLLKKKPKGGVGDFPDYGDSVLLDPSPAGTPEEWTRWLAARHELQPPTNTASELAHALSIHTGREQDDSGFDVSRFEGPPVGHKIDQPKPMAVQTRPPQAQAHVQADDEILADPEFIAEMDALKAEKL